MFFLFLLCKHPLLWRGLGRSVSWGGLSLGEVCLLGRSVYKKQLLMKRDNQLLSRRNRLICEMFFSLLREGMPAMRAYAATGNAFFLSEAQVRRIVSANA